MFGLHFDLHFCKQHRIFKGICTHKQGKKKTANTEQMAV